MNSSKKITTGMVLALGIALVAVGLLFGAQAASAQDNGPTISPSACMQRIFIGPTGNVSSSNKLNCTANDIRLSRAISVSPERCNEGETFTLTATFETIVTANARYDGGFFFRTDGGANARGDGSSATGTCSLSELTRSVSPALNLDGDTCGDLNSGTYNLTFTIPNVLCHDSNGDGFLNLPNCTSWHSNQATACTIGNQFDFDPDTKSKCVCDDNFQVPVTVEKPPIVVEKSAAPTEVPETGGTVTYTVQITNGGTFASLTITSLNDNLYGDLASTTNSNVSDNTCPTKVGTVLAPGASTSCSFKAFVSGNAGQIVTDVVTVCGTNSAQIASCGEDDADVTITDVFTAPTLVKTAQSAACTADVSYQVVVNNNSAIDTLTVNALNDDKFGDITTAHAAGGGFAQVVSTTCTLPQPAIATKGNFTCSFVGRIISDSCDFTHTNTVTGNVTDSDGKSPTTPPSDSATVTVTKTFQ